MMVAASTLPTLKPAAATFYRFTNKNSRESAPANSTVGVSGKCLADVAQCRRAEQGIGNRMQQHVSVRMSEQTGSMRNRHAADNQFSVFNQSVAVVTLTDTKIRDGIIHCHV